MVKVLNLRVQNMKKASANAAEAFSKLFIIDIQKSERVRTKEHLPKRLGECSFFNL